MSWTERQRAMLEAMGLRVWTPAAADAAPTVRLAPTGSPSAPAEVVPAAAPAAEAAARRMAPVRLAAAPPTSAGAPAREAGPARDGIESLDWPALREAVAGCRACPLCEQRRHTVFGVGHEQAQWMIVGEAPGEQEDRRGEPFVGPAGRLLDAMLASIGLTREAAPPERQVFIANTLKCRPPGNRNPSPQETAQCEPFLMRQVALVRPRIILAMGKFAVQSLLRSDLAIGRLRGQVHRYEGVPLVVTYHPAYLLRQPLDKARAWEDLCLARAVADGRPVG